MAKHALRLAVATVAWCFAAASVADEAAAKKWIDQEFQPSSLTKDQQLGELMKSARKAARPAFDKKPKRFEKRLDKSVRRDGRLAEPTPQHVLVEELPMAVAGMALRITEPVLEHLLGPIDRFAQQR